ncbi:MAG: cytidylyltransferase domain-containing protein [Fibrobacterota bacterium]
MKTAAFIPARGGSKGVPGKNIRPFLGQPLIVHSIDVARRTEGIDDVWVSTDDDEIARISAEAGARVLTRPAELAGDTASTESAIAHAFTYFADRGLRYDRMVLLQATSPLRPPDALARALEKFDQGRCDSLVSISPTHRFFWKIDGETAHAQYDYMNRPRRQDMSPDDIHYVENGSLYIFTRTHFEAYKNRLGGKIGYIIFDEDYAGEIDTESDFIILEEIARKKRQET